MTWSTRLTTRRGPLVLWFTIQGIETVFKESDAVDASAILGETRAEYACIVKGSIEEGEGRIDFDQLVMKGGSFSARLVEKFGQTTLADIIQPRRRRTTFVRTDANTTDATINVGNANLLPAAAGTVYIGAETITHTGRTATTITGCTRHKWGSRAQSHRAASSLFGASVYDVPPMWRGRRITLYATWLDEVSFAGKATNSTTLGTFIMERAPRLEDNVWTIDAMPLMDEIVSRKVYVGFDDIEGGKIVNDDDDERFTVDCGSARMLTPSADGFPSFAMVKTEGGLFFAGEIYAIDTTAGANNVTLKIDHMIGSYGHPIGVHGQRGDVRAESLRHVATVGGVAPDPLFYILVSREGDGALGSYDRLPGVLRTSFQETTVRMGAAMPADEIDTASFDISSRLWWYILDKTATVGEVLRDWCRAAEAFAYTSPDGLLTAQRLADIRGASAYTIDAGALVGDRGVELLYDEESVKPLIRLECNYTPISQEYLVKMTTGDAEMAQRYPSNDETFVIQSKSLGLDMQTNEWPQQFNRPITMTLGEAETWIRTMQRSDGRGRLLLRTQCRLSALVLALGDLVEINLDTNDLEGGSLQGRTGRVVARRPRYNDGQVDLEIEVMETVFVFAPSCTIQSVSTTSIANDTLNFLSTAPDIADASPTQHFYVNQVLRWWKPTAGTTGTVTIAQILSGTSVRLTAGYTLGVASEDWVTWNTNGTSTAGAPAGGYEEAQLAFFVQDDNENAAGEVRRWR